MKMLLQHLHAQPVAPSQRTELPIPRELDELVLACLQKDPKLRPRSAAELLHMTQACRTCDGWGPAEARRWWESHLPQFTGPLRVSDQQSSRLRRSVIA
jgi:serine/threonine protein kinase